LPGEHQAWNAALALAALRAAGVRLTDEAVRAGLSATEWPARFQKLGGGRIVVDGAHNAHGVAALLSAWRREYGDERAAVVYGAVAPRDVREIVELLAPVAASWDCAEPDSPRAIPVTEVAAVIPGGVPVREHESLAAALAAARESGSRVLVCGSLYLCGEVLALLQGGVFESSAQ
jgi:dihydrofolate synthase/folylpolyglutamate synthase